MLMSRSKRALSWQYAPPGRAPQDGSQLRMFPSWIYNVSMGNGLGPACPPTSCREERPGWPGGRMVAHAYEIGHHPYEHEYTVHKGRDGTTSAVVWREDIVKYLLVFNPKAKRYSRASEAILVRQAAKLLRGTVA